MRFVFNIIALGAILAFPLPSLAEVYMYKDSAGNILLTDTPRKQKHLTLASVRTSDLKERVTGAKLKRLSYTSSSKTSSNTQYFTRYTSLIKEAARKYKLDHKLISAVIQVESQFRPEVVSRSGAVGLMQLMPLTAKQLGVTDRLDPAQNIEGGTKYLRYLIERFKGDVTLALAGYNAGPLHVEKYGKVPPFKETQRYIKKIFSIYKGSKTINLAATGHKTIDRITMANGTVVYTNYLSNGSQSH